MRILSATLLLALLVPAARAQERADPTAQIPKDSPVAFRIASFDRVDALVKEWLPILKTFGLGQQVAPLEQMPASAFLFMVTGLNAEMVDRTKPIYVGLANEEEPVVVLHPAEGAAWDGKKELAQGAFAVVRGGAIVVAEGGLLDAEVRGTPTTFRVDGDAVVHVYLSDLIAASKEEIEGMATEAAMGIAAQGAIPEQARALILPVVTAAKDGVLSLEALDYGASWTDGRLETEGFVSIREGSGLRNLMKRVGDPGSTDLVAYLPKEAYMTMSVAMNADWPSKELKALLEQAGGTDVAKALMQLMSMGSAFEDCRTGRAAISVNMLMMSASVMTLVELKPGTDPAQVLGAFDAAKTNDALAKIGIPISQTIEKNVGKHKVKMADGTEREIAIHRMNTTSDDPDMAMMFASMQGCFAIDKDLVLMAMSPTGEDDLRALLDKVNSGQKDMDNPHMKAMARLAPRGCNVGFTINLGALKPMAMMFGMMGMPREVAQVIQAVPDVLPLSTAITFPDGNIRWRGDWPVMECVKIAQQALGAAPGEAQPPPPAPEDEGEKFD